MERRVVIEGLERVTPGDFNNFGLFPQESLDHVVHDIGLSDAGFVGFAVSGAVNDASVVVGAGRLYIGDDDRTRVFFNSDEGGFAINLLKLLPLVTRRYITIGVYGNEIPTDGDSRTFLTDPTTRATIARITSVESRRRAEIGPYGGQEGPDPQPIGLPANVLAVAYVLLAPTGIVSITPAEDNRLPSVRANDLALKENAQWRAKAGSKIDTLGSDISALASRIVGLASDVFLREVAGDVSLLKERAQLPSSYSSYDADHYLTPLKTELGHVDNLCTVMEGIRYAPANSTDAQLGLLNSLDSNAVVQNFFCLPAYDEAARLAMLPNDSELSISQYSFQTLQYIQKSRTVQRVRYGTPFAVCSNNVDWWQGAVIDYNNWTVYKGGATYSIINTAPQIGIPPGHEVWRLEQVWTDQVEEAYWDFNTVTANASGSVMSQTFLNTQDGWLTSIDLLFTKVAAAGDVTILLCGTSGGQPDVQQVYGRTVLTVGNIKAAPAKSRVQIAPTLLKKGVRYSLVLITPGNHFVGITNDNKFNQGTLFYSTDGDFYLGDLTKDLCFGLNFAKFRAPYVELQLNPLQLGGGIAAIDITNPSAVPSGTQLVFMIQDPATGTWSPLTGASGGNALLGLPPLVQFKVALIGTADLMPGFGVGSDARVVTTRPRPDKRHISTVRTLPAPCKNISVKCRLENWRGAGHQTHTCKIITGALALTGVGDTITNYAAMTEVPAPDDPQRAVIRTYTFVLAAAVSAFRIRQEGTTDNVLTTPHVAERIDIDQP